MSENREMIFAMPCLDDDCFGVAVESIAIGGGKPSPRRVLLCHDCDREYDLPTMEEALPMMRRIGFEIRVTSDG